MVSGSGVVSRPRAHTIPMKVHNQINISMQVSFFGQVILAAVASGKSPIEACDLAHSMDKTIDRQNIRALLVPDETPEEVVEAAIAVAEIEWKKQWPEVKEQILANVKSTSDLEKWATITKRVSNTHPFFKLVLLADWCIKEKPEAIKIFLPEA